MKNSITVVALVLLLVLVPAVDAQQAKKILRIGYLSATTPAGHAASFEAFQQRLRELGYVEGKNIIIEYRYAEGKSERLPALVADLIDLKVDLIVTHGFPPARAAKQATKTIPIVMGVIGDAVGAGLVASLARPGGNITGFTSISSELYGKRLELLKEVSPKISRVRSEDRTGHSCSGPSLSGQRSPGNGRNMYGCCGHFFTPGIAEG